MSAEPAARSVPVDERQFSLILALIATDVGLTKAQILSTVTGYAGRYRLGADNTAVERQFERDKDDLRELGVPLETIDAAGAEGDTKLQRYRVSQADYPLPDDIVFTAEEHALLALAAQVWREGSLSDDSRRALVKLRALGAVAGDAVIGYAPTVRTRDAAHEPLTTAISRGRQVDFAYLKPGDAGPRTRRVSPLALVQHEGRWHLHAHDEDLDAPRTFLLQRMLGRVRVRDLPARTPRPDEAARVLAELSDLWRRSAALVHARPDSEAEVMLRNRRGTEPEGENLRLRSTDLDVLADELVTFGADVRVLEPTQLVDAVRARWSAVEAAHG